MSHDTPGGEKLIVANRKARHSYEILETYEAGLALLGPEVKSLREGKVNLGDAYAVAMNGELVLQSLHISPYLNASWTQPDPLRPRKLLLHRREIAQLVGKITQQGLTLVPLRLYFKRGKVKVELGLARGRKLHDKRDHLKEQELRREAAAALKAHNRR